MLTVAEMRQELGRLRFGDGKSIQVKQILEILDECCQEILDLVEDHIEIDELPSTTKLYDLLYG